MNRPFRLPPPSFDGHDAPALSACDPDRPDEGHHDGPPCGWHESSLDLREGLYVTEHALPAGQDWSAAWALR
jgi:hypothetical protein